MVLFTPRRLFVLLLLIFLLELFFFVSDWHFVLFVPPGGMSPNVSCPTPLPTTSRFVGRKNVTLPWCEDLVDQSLKVNRSFVVNVSRVVRSWKELEKRWSASVSFGGYSYSLSCRERDSLALIICYRQREEHLKLFLDHFHAFLTAQHVHYQIFVVNQHGAEDFNRGSLFNVGFVQALKIFPFSCWIFHDVDLFPEDHRNLYRCHSHPQHLSVAIDKFYYRLLYASLFGGATSFRTEDFLAANGYPNIYWGWGNEDDDMSLRVQQRLNKSIFRYPLHIARYQMIRQFGHRTSEKNPHRDKILFSKYSFDLDGLNTLRYHLHQITFSPLFTLFNVSLFQQSFAQISRRLNFTVKAR